ncbi:MAG: alkaline phosphatase D family protein, partial [Solirubrobacterales bacterium]|nr:alkaline phosphatase D family protein [Solirubrobacterales bacterium]
MRTLARSLRVHGRSRRQRVRHVERFEATPAPGDSGRDDAPLLSGMRPCFPDGELGRWAGLGGVTERSVRVWLRDPAGAPHRAVLDVEGGGHAEITLTPDPDHDFTVAADIVLDRPRPDAAFTVHVAGLQRHGRLAPEHDAPTEVTFGFGSCHQPFGPPRDGVLTVTPRAGIYRQMVGVLRSRGARFLSLIGDQIYSDGVDPIDVRDNAHRAAIPPTDDELREAYRWLHRGYFNVAPFRELLAAQPTLMTWDDHDITEGWGALIDWDDLDWRVFRAAEATYREYQHVRNVGASVHDRAPYSRCSWFGNVGFFILDLRGLRSYREGRLLGTDQWRQLEGFLEQCTRHGTPTVVITAGIPVVHHAPALVRFAERVHHRYGTDLRDRWCAAPINPERVRFLNLLLDWQSAQRGRQVVIISG